MINESELFGAVIIASLTTTYYYYLLLFTMTTTKIPNYKLLLVGDGGVGKTAFLRCHRTGEFERRYIATMGVEVHPLKFHTNYGPVNLHVWDVAGQEKFGGLRDAYYIHSDAAMIMFSIGSSLSYSNVPTWHRDVTAKAGNIPIVICGNQVDRGEHLVKSKHITYPYKAKLQYYGVSVKSNYHYDRPFLYLIRRLLGKQDLEFVKAPGSD